MCDSSRPHTYLHHRFLADKKKNSPKLSCSRRSTDIRLAPLWRGASKAATARARFRSSTKQPVATRPACTNATCLRNPKIIPKLTTGKTEKKIHRESRKSARDKLWRLSPKKRSSHPYFRLKQCISYNCGTSVAPSFKTLVKCREIDWNTRLQSIFILLICIDS